MSHQFPSIGALNRISQSLSPCEKPPRRLKTEPADQQLLVQKQFSTYFTAATGHQHLTFLASSQVSELCILFYFLSSLTNKLVLSQLHKLYRKQIVLENQDTTVKAHLFDGTSVKQESIVQISMERSLYKKLHMQQNQAKNF